jgi:hypothetical protein
MFLRTEAAAKADLEIVDDHFARVLGVQPDHSAATEVVRALIQARCDDYMRQRWRDWPVADLITLLTVLEPIPIPKEKRPLTLRMIWNLHSMLGIPAESLIQPDYELRVA